MPDTRDPLQQPLTLPCGAELPNRIAKAAMTEGLADERLRATEAHERVYRLWSEGGAGLLITGNFQIDRHNLERAGNVAVDTDGNDRREPLAAMARAGTVGGNHLWMQISHAGRQTPAYINRHPGAPSATQLKILYTYGRPVALADDEIRALIGRFGQAAGIAREAGFTGVQIHAAHGYLFSQFLSPLVNKRTDDWGGSLDNRARILLESVAAARAAVGLDFPVAVKLNSADFQKGGFAFDECLRVVEWLNQAGVDLLEISGGSYEQPGMVGHRGDADAVDPDAKASTREREAYFIEYARQVRQTAAMPLMLTGGFRSRPVMEAAIENNDVDAIGLGRPLVVEPHFVRRLFEGTSGQAYHHERDMQIGPGWLGPASRSMALKFMNIFGQMGWYYLQILRLGAGREPDFRMGVLRGLFGHLLNEYRTRWRIRRYLRDNA